MTITISSDTRIDPGVVVTVAPSSGGGSDFAYTYYGTGADLPNFSIGGVVNFNTSSGSAGGFTIDPYGGTGSSGLFHIESTGEFHISSDATGSYPYYAHVWGFYAPQWSIPFLNDGLLDVSSPDWATGVESWDGQTVTNTGTIQVYGGHLAVGVERGNGGGLNNSGLISVSGDGPTYGVYVDAGSLNLQNTGTIRATTTSTYYASIAVFVADTADAEFHNAGVLQGDYAFYSYDGEGVGSTLATSDLFYNTGDLAGAVYLAYGDDIMHNAGTQEGFTDLAAGNDIYDGALGRNTGGVYGGDGDDTLIGGAYTDVLYGGSGNDTLSGGGGNDRLDGGHGSDAIDGGSGYDTVSYLNSTAQIVLDLSKGTATSGGTDKLRSIEAAVGGRFNDVLTGSAAANQLEGNDGNDRISGGDGNDTLIGDRGADTLTGGAGADNFIFNVGDGKDVITDFQSGTGDKLSIYGYAHAVSIAALGTDTVIQLSSSDRIILKGVDAANFDTSSLVFHSAARAISPTAQGPDPVVTSDLVIKTGETWAFTDPAGVHVPDMTYLATGIVIDPVVFVDSPSLYNAGKISLTVTTGSDAAVAITTDSTIGDGPVRIYNQATGVIEVIVQNEPQAIAFRGYADFWNAGHVNASSWNGDALGIFNHLVVNSGTIDVSAKWQAVGVVSHAFSASEGVWNSGDILVSGGTASIGVQMFDSFYSCVNSGHITVTDTTIALDSVGIELDSNSLPATVFNSGVIQADYAIRQIATSTPAPDTPSTIYNTGELHGLVDLGSGEDQLYNNGLITGQVQLGDGADLYDGRGGTEQGGVDGGNGDDTLLAGAGADILTGGAGNDVLSGGAGADTLSGGAGNDSFRFEVGSGADVINDFTAGGTDDVIVVVGYSGYQSLVQQGADTKVVFSATDYLLLKNVQASSLTSADFAFSAAALDPTPAFPTTPLAPAAPVVPNTAASFPLIGTSASETLQGGTGADNIFGEGGNDKLIGGAGDDRLDGGAGNDTLTGGAGYNTMEGGTGADRFVWQHGDGEAEVIDFHESEHDYIVLPLGSTHYLDFSDSGVLVHVTQNGQEVGLIEVRGASLPAVEAAIRAPTMLLLDGTTGADVLTGTAADEHLRGFAGDDLLKGGAGNDQIDGGDGADVLMGGAGDDYMSGNAGIDTASYADATAGVTVALGIPEWQDTVGAGWDTLLTIENLTGSNYADHLWGDQGANVLSGGLGNDVLHGDLGNDTLNGDAGADQLLGEDGADTLNGGDGNDILDGGAGNDLLHGDVGADALAGGYGDDQLFGDDSNDVLHGDSGTDQLSGDAGNDILYGGDGADTLHGGDGVDILYGDDGESYYGSNDHLFGDAGADTLYGYSGADELTGGAGIDQLYGGTGADKFIYTALSDSMRDARDVIHDFDPAADHIDISAIDARTDVVGDQAFQFVNSFDGQQGEAMLSWSSATNTTALILDVNGDKAGDFYVTIVGHVIDASGFIL